MSVHRNVDVILIDCPPAFAVDAECVCCGEWVLVPIQAEHTLEGLSMLIHCERSVTI